MVPALVRLRPSWTWVACILALGLDAGAAHATRLEVPLQFAGIQPALDAAQDGDTVLVSPGTYPGGLAVAGKTVTIASRFVITGDTADIVATTIQGGDPVLALQVSVGEGTTVRGLSFLAGGHQLVNFARRVDVLDCRFAGGVDQVSFEGAGGRVQGCTFDGASDDAIDVDDDSDPTIVGNVIRYPDDDGIELRLHPYTGATLSIVIRDNVISGCGEDGIQLIDYAGLSSRDFTIEHNVIAASAKAGLACMADGNTVENFAGAPLVEPVRVVGNTFHGNPYGIIGGDNMLVMNNIVSGSAVVGARRLTVSSLVTHTDFWGNASDHVDANVAAGTLLSQDPLFDAGFSLQPSSPCIDAGAASIEWNGGTVEAPSWVGTAPDLGARESPPPPLSVGDRGADTGLELSAPWPSPSRGWFNVQVRLAGGSPARLDLLDLAGRLVASRAVSPTGPGPTVVRLDPAGTLPAGVYLVRLAQAGRALTRRGVVVR